MPEDAESFLIRVPPELLRSLRTLAGMRKTRSLNVLVWLALSEWGRSQPEHELLKKLGMAFPSPSTDVTGSISTVQRRKRGQVSES